MIRFLKMNVLFLLGFVCLTVVAIVVRVASWNGTLQSSMKLKPQQKVLMVGDSHVGCTFVEDAKYGNRVLWQSSAPLQFTWMRLRNMERVGALANVDTLVIEFGFQTFGQQRSARMAEFWWRMLPIAWRYSGDLPVSWWDRLSYLVQNPAWQIVVAEASPASDVSILERTAEERDRDFAIMTNTHFGWYDVPNQMCDGWEDSLRVAIVGIVDLCKRNNIRLVCLTAPLTSVYRAAIPSAVEAKLRSYVDLIRALGVEYHDLRVWGEDRYFRDCFHFTVSGARLFTQYFYSDFLK